ncbi:hypothetical protein A6V39_05480 [Candidatus Mycoplasma haematobovis]|uniref:Uncharacterized protein n=1 Tax=Candidatus Mycoplasma haematobovis TaxID=432608 RepID=A0A1A9QCR2_9MOLU|nr:hypothetical protein A6V39_05480 [Candidatus Mycoplasma haematobovis]
MVLNQTKIFLEIIELNNHFQKNIHSKLSKSSLPNWEGEKSEKEFIKYQVKTVDIDRFLHMKNKETIVMIS